MKNFKSFFSGVSCAVLLVGTITTALAAYGAINISVAPNILVIINGTSFAPKLSDGSDLMLLNHDSTVYVPARAFAEEFDLRVDWDNPSNTISISRFAWSDLAYDVDQDLYKRFEELVSFEKEFNPDVAAQFVTDRVFVFKCNTTKEEFRNFWSSISHDQRVAIVENKAIETMVAHGLRGNESCSIYFDYSGSVITGGISLVLAYDYEIHTTIVPS